MSSIYKKGRDGYFYYQTYQYNSDTGKKDKKIFHSLGTKDRDVAIKKKIQLDRKYASKSSWFSQKKIILIFLFTFISMYYFYFQLNKKNNDQLDDKEHLKSNYLDKIVTDKELVNLESSSIKDEVTSQSNEKVKLIDKSTINGEEEQNPTLQKKEEILIPKFIIQRSEELSTVFNQIKIFANVYGKYNKAGLLETCRTIKEEHSKYKSITLCLFDSSPEGINVAKGISEISNSAFRDKLWLVLYSYNEVEGEYFDDKPNAYSGMY